MEALWNFLAQWGLLPVALAGVGIAALANGLETGLYRINRVRLFLRAEEGDGRARILRTLLGDLRGMIIVCLIGTNAGAFLATAVATMLVASAGWVGGSAGVEILTTAIVTPVLFVFADVVPKSIFTVEADRWMYRMARPLQWAYELLRGLRLVQVLKGLSGLAVRIARKREGEGADPLTPRQRLSALLRESAAEGVISGYQGEIVEKVLALRDRPVSQVMIPLKHVAAVPADIGRDAFVGELRQHSYSRLPVYEAAREQVVGIVRINDVLAVEGDPFDLRAVMSRDVVAVPPEMTVSQALIRLRKARAAMAIVSDPKARALGIVTIKDLVEEIVGELAAW